MDYRVDAPKAKKSTDDGLLGTASFEDAFSLFSKEMFAFPFVSDGGRSEVEAKSLVLSKASVSLVSWSFTNCDGIEREELNTRPGPDLPPRTRCGTGAVCFGAGSIDNNDEAPALVRAFLVGGSSCSLSTEVGKLGSPIVIFLDRFGLDVVITVASALGAGESSGSLSLPLP